MYFTYFESSLKQATIGKQLMNMKVVDKNGFRLTPANALIRNLSKIHFCFILFIGYLMAAFDAQKQSLHDKIAGTFVVKV
ncbi:MAG: RDD family protein [Bacteroidetes bacterium]|nr:RDD family protein [Bacteroidota bacterium]